MATGGDVLGMLIPAGGWVITGNDWEGVQFIDATPITQAQFQAGFAQYDAWKAEQDAQVLADKAGATSKLEALGLTADELKTLLS